MSLMLAAVPQPIYALADSRLLFGRKRDGSLFLKSMIERPGVVCPRVAYVGASNSDRLEYYHDIFEPALRQMGSCQLRMILTRPLAEEGEFLQRAEVIVLAGGSVEAGWRAFVQNGFRELILRRFAEGVTLIGVSAGAVQLGQGGLTEEGTTLLTTFGLLPFYVGVHEEQQNWEGLHQTLAMAPKPARGIGLPSGAGLIYNVGEVEPVGHSLQEIMIESGPARKNLLFSSEL
jgi:cyanophycinase